MKNNLYVSVLKCSLMMIKGNILQQHFFGVSPCFIFFIQYAVRVYALLMFFLCYLLNTGLRITYDERHIRYRVTYTGVFHKIITILS